MSDTMDGLMFGSEPMTKREILIARDAFVAGAQAGFSITPMVSEWRGMSAEAAARYPLPKVTRPRVVDDPARFSNQKWRVGESGALECLVSCHGWMRFLSFRERADFAPLPERVKVWADLLANPTEEVEE